jgi:hypothetical protein
VVDPATPWYKIPEWWLCILGAPTLLIVGWQSWETRKAAKAGSESAKAALLNAQAVINAERPWILIRGQAFEVKDVSSVVATNCGRTPAKITTISLDSWKIVPSNTDLPLRPIYQTPTSLPTPIVLLPEGTTYVYTLSELDVRRICHTDLQWNRVQSGEDMLYVFGVIYYEDLLNSPTRASHETRWCCRYLPGTPSPSNRLVLSGSPGYNDYT